MPIQIFSNGFPYLSRHEQPLLPRIRWNEKNREEDNPQTTPTNEHLTIHLKKYSIFYKTFLLEQMDSCSA